MNPSTKIFLAIIIAALIIGASIYFALINSAKIAVLNQVNQTTPTTLLNPISSPTTTSSNNINTTTSTSLTDITKWKTFQDPKTKFTFQYPSNFLKNEPKLVVFDCDVTSFTKDCPSLGTGATSQAIQANGLNVCLYEKSVTSSGNIYLDHYYVMTTEFGCLGLDLVTLTTNCDSLKGTDSYNQCVDKNTNVIPQVFKTIESTFQFNS
ncbi:MAG: hypothetical protein ACP5RX_00985 [Minisyncoccia bacterium]